jgi:hypothetical protein
VRCEEPSSYQGGLDSLQCSAVPCGTVWCRVAQEIRSWSDASMA